MTITYRGRNGEPITRQQLLASLHSMAPGAVPCRETDPDWLEVVEQVVIPEMGRRAREWDLEP